MSEIAATVGVKTGREMATDLVVRLLRMAEGFEWLDEQAGWFWFRSVTSNRVVRRIRKILAVAGSVHIGELRTGIGRHYQMRGYSPPRHVLLELCKTLSFCKVVDDVVTAKDAIDWRHLLRGTDLTLVTVLKAHGPVMQRADLERRCMELGMNRSTFYIYLEYSPLLDRFASGVYGLRGAKIDAGVVESMIPRVDRQRSVRLDHGWTEDRRIWIQYRISNAMLANGVISVPPGLKETLAGSYSLMTADGTPVGTVVVKDYSAWGLGTLFRRRGGETGDILQLVFDVSGKAVCATIGDDSLAYAPPGAESGTENICVKKGNEPH